MTIRRVDDTVLLEEVCDVEDAEILLSELVAGGACIDWSGCTHLHTACLQVIMAAGLPVCGSPTNPALSRWLTSILRPIAAPAARETPIAFQIEA